MAIHSPTSMVPRPSTPNNLFSLEIKNNGLASDFCLAGETLSLCGLDNLIELILSSGTFFVILHAQSENYQIIKNIYTRF